MAEFPPQLEDLRVAYQQGWSAAAGVSGIHNFLSERTSFTDADRRLLLSLIRVDMENSWSQWSQAAERMAQQSGQVDELLDAWKSLPRFQHYAALFSGPEEAGRYWTELANFESYCRDRWGDSVGTKYYDHYFQVTTDEYLKRTRRHLRCEFENNEDFSQVLFPLRGTSEVGRQRSKDQDPYFCEVNPDGNRIVIASRHEAEVSREQLILQMLSPKVAVLTNRSTINSIRVTPDITLEPGSRTVGLFPFVIHLPGRRLCCY